MRVDPAGLLDAAARAERELGSHLKSAVMMVADLIVNDARRTALFRDRTGALRGSITRGNVVDADGNFRLDLSAGSSGTVKYAEYVHEGTRPHDIEPNRRKALRFVGRGGDFAFARKVRHPGTRPRPFLTQAAERNVEAAERIIGRAAILAFTRAGFQAEVT